MAAEAHDFLKRHVLGLIEASQDRQFREDVAQNVRDLPADTKNFLKGVAVGDAGFLSEIMQGYTEGDVGMYGVPSAMKNIRDMAPKYETPKTEGLGKALGADTESKAFTAGTFFGVPDVTDIAKGAAKFMPALMTAFHGSPHKWAPEVLAKVGDKVKWFKKGEVPKGAEIMQEAPLGRPRLEAVGTGEGAQAYGHGLYFAENPGVASQYKMALSPSDVLFDGRPVPKGSKLFATNGNFNVNGFVGAKPKEIAEQLGVSMEEANALSSLGSFDSIDEAIESARRASKESWRGFDGQSSFKRQAEILEGMRDRISINPDAGHLYEVDIPDEAVAKMLDWDAPLSEQPESVRKFLDGIENSSDPMVGLIMPLRKDRGASLFKAASQRKDFTGEELLTLLRNQAIKREGKIAGKDAEAVASKVLKEAGIPGIKYFDGDSRLAGKPFREVKRSFLNDLPEDAEFDDVVELIGTGYFTKEQDEVIKALQADDWLGFDYPSQAINAAYADNVRKWEPSDRLLKALDESAGGKNRTRNLVIFDTDIVKVLSRDGEKVAKAGKTPFAKSVVKEPVFHGTHAAKQIDEYSEYPAYFTDNKEWSKNFGPNTNEAYLDIKNPEIIDGESSGRHFYWDAEDVAEFKAEGKDGVIIRHPDGNVYTVFSKDQIKTVKK